MPSLFKVLLDTMPFAAARGAAWRDHRKEIAELELHEASEYFRLYEPDQHIDIELPQLGDDLEAAVQPIWAWSQASGDPATVKHVYCRVRDADNVGHRAADSISWGLEDETLTFRRCVRITQAAGAQTMLPLTKEFVVWKWVVHKGYLPQNATPLWRLESIVDTSLVVVFAYDIDPSTGEPVPVDITDAADPAQRELLRGAADAAKELLGKVEPVAPPPPPTPWGENPQGGQGGAQSSSAPWGFRVTQGDIWSHSGKEPKGGSGSSGSVSGEVGETCVVSTAPGRVLVVLTFSFCCERSDFEPGGIVGFARCYPHLLVQASIPLTKIEASARLDRPKHMDRWEESGRDMAANCCKPSYDGWYETISSLLVADTNYDDSYLPGPKLPFWPNFFSHALVDPFEDFGPTSFHVVRTDRPDRRESNEGWVVRDVVGAPPKRTFKKVSRQGELDNIHVAPRLRLKRIKHISFPSRNPTPAGDGIPYPVDPKAMHFDEIAMAPFCAHDCLHLHWRWSEGIDVTHTFGWDGGLPYQKSGAPMVPENQDVWLRFRSEHALTYHVVAGTDDAPGHMYPHEWQVFMHHGFGMAVAITGMIEMFLAQCAFATLGGNAFFHDDEGKGITVAESTALFYWVARYRAALVNGVLTAVPRITYGEGGLDLARDL